MKAGTRYSRMTRGDIAFEIVNMIILAILTIIIIYPLVYVVSASFSEPMAVAAGKVRLFPVQPTLENYKEVFKNASIIRGYRNSLIILVLGTAVNLVMTILAAFPMSRRDLWGRNVIMKLMTFTMFFSGGMIPTYLLITRTLGWMNNWLALIMPGAISVYNMIIMRTFFTTSIPYELQEAADIDGCTPFGVLMRIMLPLSGPILAVLGLYYGVGHWNGYFSALLYINKEELQPLQLYLRQILTQNSSDVLTQMGGDDIAAKVLRAETIKYSVLVVASVPMLVIYPFVQRFFVKGVMIGAIKG